MILSKWLLPTRLETRTKESITYASVRVEKPERQPKGSIRCETLLLQHRPSQSL